MATRPHGAYRGNLNLVDGSLVRLMAGSTGRVSRLFVRRGASAHCKRD